MNITNYNKPEIFTKADFTGYGLDQLMQLEACFRHGAQNTTSENWGMFWTLSQKCLEEITKRVLDK